MNLLINSSEANMKSPLRVTIHANVIGEYIHIQYKDNGTGIPTRNSKITCSHHSLQPRRAKRSRSLYFVLRLLGNNDGDIRYHPTQLGSHFELIIPKGSTQRTIHSSYHSTTEREIINRYWSLITNLKFEITSIACSLHILMSPPLLVAEKQWGLSMKAKIMPLYCLTSSGKMVQELIFILLWDTGQTPSTEVGLHDRSNRSSGCPVLSSKIPNLVFPQAYKTR